jgi:transcriptional regulator with XRE-family HTH domain
MIARHIAQNLRLLRESRGISQNQAAKLAEIPRPTWASLETGSANPTISVLMKVSGALQVPLEELISAPRSEAQYFPAREFIARKRGGALVRRVLPESLQSMELDRMEFPPAGRFGGVPHRPGTREYLYCESGTIELSASGEVWTLQAGDVLVFRGDQHHSYRNSGRKIAVGLSLILFGTVK